MKQKDLTLIIVIVFVSGMFSFLISRVLINTSNQKQEVEVVEPITAEFTQPSDKYFNSSSTNPTQLIEIGENKNETPFDDSGN